MPTAHGLSECGAVILAGGTAVRMDGVDKASVELSGRTLLAHALDAVVDARETVVVGDPVPTERPVTFTREEPSGGGPAAGLLAALDAFVRRPPLVAVLAVDMPRVRPATFERLLAAGRGHDGALLVGPDGRRQLCGVLSVALLDAVAPQPEFRPGLAMHRLLSLLDLAEVPAVGDEARDVDSWADLRDLRENVEET